MAANFIYNEPFLYFIVYFPNLFIKIFKLLNFDLIIRVNKSTYSKINCVF